MKKKHRIFLSVVYCIIQISLCSDITSTTFGSITDGMPAAFGDFNSDELTDLFVMRDDTVQILLGSTKEPLFIVDSSLKCSYKGYRITSVVPGDFDGDAMMDVLVTAREVNISSSVPLFTYVFIAWGGINHLNCDHKSYYFKMIDEPLAAVDHSKNLTVNLFGLNTENERVFWNFNSSRSDPEVVRLSENKSLPPLRTPHSHAFLDWNNDNSPDLYLTAEDGYEIWLWNNIEPKFEFDHRIQLPVPQSDEVLIGQTLFMDLEIADKMNQIVPVCEKNCERSAIYVYHNETWCDLNVNFSDNSKLWGFVPPTDAKRYTETITLRAGDFNNDGYVDMLATLRTINGKEEYGSFLLENIPTINSKCNLGRTFLIQWGSLSPHNKNSVMGTFYDFLQDGILDIIFVHLTRTGYNVSAFKNSLDYDANFIKVMVSAGLRNDKIELPQMLLGAKRLTFGTNLPGPKIRYKTMTQEGIVQAGVAVQLPQSAHFALYLPYTIFGLGRTPNFIEDLTIGMFNESRTWNQIIPNSQLVVIPFPPNNPSLWRAQLFVTPSKIVIQTVFALLGTCIMIAFIIIILHWNEKREDRRERLQENNRFHYAM